MTQIRRESPPIWVESAAILGSMTIFAPQGSIRTPVRITFRAYQNGNLFDYTFNTPASTYDTGSGEVILDEQLRLVQAEKIAGGYGPALSGPPGYKANVLADSPNHYYRMDAEPIIGVGNIPNLGSSGGNGLNGLNTNWTRVTGLTADGDRAWASAGGTPYFGAAVNNIFNVATPFTLEAVVSMVVTSPNGQMIFASSHATDGRQYSYFLRTASGATGTFGWAPRGNVGGAGSVVSWAGITTAQWPEGAPVHIALTWSGATRVAELFVNGISLGTRTSTTDIAGTPTFGPIFGTWYQGSMIWPMASGSVIDEVAAYPVVLSSARIAAHAAARLIP